MDVRSFLSVLLIIISILYLMVYEYLKKKNVKTRIHMIGFLISLFIISIPLFLTSY